MSHKLYFLTVFLIMLTYHSGFMHALGYLAYKYLQNHIHRILSACGMNLGSLNVNIKALFGLKFSF